MKSVKRLFWTIYLPQGKAGALTRETQYIIHLKTLYTWKLQQSFWYFREKKYKKKINLDAEQKRYRLLLGMLDHHKLGYLALEWLGISNYYSNKKSRIKA